MLLHFQAALLAIIVAGAPLGTGPQRSSGEPLSAKEIRKAEAGARTAADHVRLAAWYQSEVVATQAQLKEAEDQVRYWSQKPGMVALTKIPNPYWNARAWAQIYREKLQKVTKRAVFHEKMAESLRSSGQSTQ